MMMDMDDDYDMEAVAMGADPLKKKKVAKTKMRKEVADKMENLERFADRIENCCALTEKQKKSIAKDLSGVRSTLTEAYTK